MIHIELVKFIVLILAALMIGFTGGAYFIIILVSNLLSDDNDWEDYDD